MREWQGGEEPETVWRRWRFGQWLYGLSLREFGAGRYRTADWGGFRRSVSGDLDYLNFFGLFGLLGALRLRAMALGLNLFGTGRQMEQVILNTNFKYIVAGLTLAQRGLLLNMLLQAGMRGDASGDEAVDNIYRYIVLEQEGIKLHAKKQRMREIGAKGLAARWGNVAAMEEETGGNGSGMAGNGSQNGMAARERKEAKENKYNNLNYFLFEEIEKEEVKGKEEKKGESVAAAVMEDRMLCGAGGNTVGTADAAETACATALKTDGRAGVAQELLKLDNRPRVPDIECGGAESECSVVAGDDGTVGVYHGVPTGCGGSEVSGSEVPVGGWPLKEKTGKRDLQLGARRYGVPAGRGGFCETDETDIGRCGLAAGIEDCEAAGQAESLSGNRGQVAADDSGRYGAAGRGGSEVSGSEVSVGGRTLKEKTGERDLQSGAERYGALTERGGFCETDETDVGRCGLAAGVKDCKAAGQTESLSGNKGQVAADDSGRYGAAGRGATIVTEIRQAPKRRGRGNRGMGRQRKETVFKIPSVAEVQAFVDADGLKVDAGTFVDFYDSRGWRVGKTAIKNWQATARLWHRRAVTEQQDKAGGGVSGGLGLPLMANSKSGSSGDEEYWHELATRVDGEDTVALEADAAAGTGAEMCPADNYDGLSPFARFMRRIEDHDLPPGGETAAGEEGYSDSEKKSIREKNDSNTEGTYE